MFYYFVMVAKDMLWLFVAISQFVFIPLISQYIRGTIYNSSSQFPKILIVKNVNKSNIVEGHIEKFSALRHLSRYFLTLVKHWSYEKIISDSDTSISSSDDDRTKEINNSKMPHTNIDCWKRNIWHFDGQTNRSYILNNIQFDFV